MLKSYLFCLLITCFSMPVFAQHSYSSLNVSYQYDINGTFLLNNQVLSHNDSSYLFLSVSTQDTEYLNNYDVLIELRDGYKNASIELEDTLSETFLIGYQNNKYLYQYTFPEQSKYKLAVIDFFNKKTGANYTFSIPVGKKINYGDDGLYILDATTGLPALEDALIKDHPYILKCLNKEISQVYSYVYNDNFDMALPPMVVEDRNVSKNLEVKTIIKYTLGDTIRFNNLGLHLVQSDTTGVLGLPFRIQKKGYPKYYFMDELIEPLAYISTKEERDAIQTSKNLRTAFEKYWIDNCRSKSVAKKTIQAFYNQVAAANLYFTNYKEGWETDMGMIYMIYGAPDEVYVEEEYETWQYKANRNLPSIRFTFVKVKNIFADRHYVLVRDRKFDRHWFKSVELWREGKKINE